MATLYLDLIYRSQSQEASKTKPVKGLAVRESRKFIISYKVKGWSSFEEVAELLGAIDARILMQTPTPPTNIGPMSLCLTTSLA